MASSIEITPELMAGFLDEAPEYLEILDAGLMEFESAVGDGMVSLDCNEDRQRMNEMFRAAHSLKGLAAAFGFDKLKELTHQMETLFDQVRMGHKCLTSDNVEMLFQVFDRLKALVHELSDPDVAPVEIEDVVAALDGVLQGTDEKRETSAPTNLDPRPVETPQCQETIGAGVFDDPELTALFYESTTEAIEELNQGLLQLEDAPADTELLNRIFRCAHNIKGASGAAGLIGMNRITHCMETVFDRLRNGQLALDDALMSAMFGTVDRLRQVIDALKSGTLADVGADELVDQFAPWISRPPQPASHPGIAGTTKPAEAHPADPKREMPGEAESPGDGTMNVTITFAKGFDEAPIQAYLMHNKLMDVGTVVHSDPDIASLTGDSTVSRLVFTVEAPLAPARLEEILSNYGAERVVVTGIGAAASAGSAPPTTNPPAAADVPNGEQPDIEATPASGGSSVPAEPVKPHPVGRGLEPARTDGTAPPDARPKTATGKRPREKDRSANRGKPDAFVVKTGETLRVDQERLDQLMNLGGELVINKARFVQIHGRFRDVFDGKNHGYLVEGIGDRLEHLRSRVAELQAQFGHHHLIGDLDAELVELTESFAPIRSVVQRVHDARLAMHDFDEALHGLDRVSGGLQKGIMGTRMIPVGPLFTRFRRVVRDISKSCGKKVELVLKGEQTELDKRMIDELSDPLTHMVRNSVDHGIELPEVRQRVGKNPTGTLTLEACHRGNSICIEVSDDGAGVNIERVKTKILEKEMANEAQLEKMSDSEVVQYILKPGFSTARQVTDLSGRGMGMDIVLAKLEQLNGTIEIDSRPGEGSKITIKLPLTLAILTAMVMRIGAGVYAVPLEAVAEIITVKKRDIQHIQRRQVVRVRDRVVPIAYFEDIFNTKSESLRTASSDSEELTLVIIGFDRDQFGLVVDELLGQEDVVIKSIAENYQNVRGFAGASIRGDGTVSLILDVPAMVEMGGTTAPARSAPMASELVEA
ncbi:MAG: Hpt domain-containing protein [Phycisphaerae bacterium]